MEEKIKNQIKNSLQRIKWINQDIENNVLLYNHTNDSSKELKDLENEMHILRILNKLLK
tara:strand:+ start:241 stop:417 length:177 start_codon:yes stop_codon:yes gene_type:complete